MYQTQTAPSPRLQEFGEVDRAHSQHQSSTIPNARPRRIDEFFTSDEKAVENISSTHLQDLRGPRDHGISPDAMQSELTDQPVIHDMSGSHEKAATGFQTSPATSSEDKKRHGLKGIFHKKDRSQDKDDRNNGKQKAEGQHFGFWSQIKATIFGSWINILLIFCKLTLIVLDRPADPSPSTNRHRSPLREAQSDCRLRHQLHRHHPTRCNAEFCDRGNRFEDG